MIINQDCDSRHHCSHHKIKMIHRRMFTFGILPTHTLCTSVFSSHVPSVPPPSWAFQACLAYRHALFATCRHLYLHDAVQAAGLCLITLQSHVCYDNRQLIRSVVKRLFIACRIVVVLCNIVKNTTICTYTLHNQHSPALHTF